MLRAYQDAGGGLLVDDITGNVFNPATGEIYTGGGSVQTPTNAAMQAAFSAQNAIISALQKKPAGTPATAGAFTMPAGMSTYLIIGGIALFALLLIPGRR